MLLRPNRAAAPDPSTTDEATERQYVTGLLANAIRKRAGESPLWMATGGRGGHVPEQSDDSATAAGTAAADDPSPVVGDLAEIRRLRVQLLQQENAILRMQLKSTRAREKALTVRLETIQASFDILTDVLISAIRSLPSSEGRRAIQLMISSVNAECPCPAPPPNDDHARPMVMTNSCPPQPAVKRMSPPPIESEEESAKASSSSSSSISTDSSSSGGELMGTSAASSQHPPILGTVDPNKVPSLRLDGVGYSAWMVGDPTAGDTYVS